MPRVSVVMPAYNAEKYIRDSIESILSQTFTDFEFIILDDGSTDATASIIQSYKDGRICFYPNERNMGVAATLNRGLELAHGEYIARMDSDDISLPERFERQVAYLDMHQDIAVLGSDLETFCDTGSLGIRVLSHSPDKLKEDLFFFCGMAHPSIMMRRDIILALGGYDLDYDGLEDYELWCRVTERYKISTLPEVLFRYRMHSGQVTKNPSPQYIERLRRLKQRQVAQLSIDTTSEEFDAYVGYCTATLPKTYSMIIALGRFFEKSASGNVNVAYYDHHYLMEDFKCVMLSLAMGTSSKDQRMLCEESRLLTLRELRYARLRAGIKHWIGKKLL